MGKFFYSDTSEIIFGIKNFDNTYKTKINNLFLSYEQVNSIRYFLNNDRGIVTICSLITVLLLTIIVSQRDLTLLLLILILIGVIAGIPFIIFLIAKFYQSFHPLYAFGNLGSKIQSFTPRISEESAQIEKEFSTDMNFRTLSDSFDTLAKDFNTIIEYVIKLETIEKKANKGNLFDSTKYINSLREDIRNPLISLRVFLEKKKTELESSQEELQKVKVRVRRNGETENLDLTSKRTEPLMQELTENIEKLDRMIEKF